MEFEIKELRPDGSGYIVITRDDGSTFGQMFQGVPVNDPALTIKSITMIAVQSLERERPVPITIAADVEELTFHRHPITMPAVPMRGDYGATN